MIIPLNIDAVLLTLKSDPSQTVRLPYITQLLPTPQTPGEDRMYGRGRYVGLSAGATQLTYQVSAAAVPAADAALLRAWDGQLLLYRDDVGERFWGSYRSPQLTRRTYSTEFDVSFTITQKTVNESV